MQFRASGGWGSVKISVLQDESDKEKEKRAAVVYKEELYQWTMDSKLGKEDVKEMRGFMDSEKVVGLVG